MTNLSEFQQEGTITGWANPPSAPDWATDSNGYTFPPFKLNNVTATCTKHPDRTVEVTVDGLFGRQFGIREPIPQCDARGLFIAITWKDLEVTFFLNGEIVKAFTV